MLVFCCGSHLDKRKWRRENNKQKWQTSLRWTICWKMWSNSSTTKIELYVWFINCVNHVWLVLILVFFFPGYLWISQSKLWDPCELGKDVRFYNFINPIKLLIFKFYRVLQKYIDNLKKNEKDSSYQVLPVLFY